MFLSFLPFYFLLFVTTLHPVGAEDGTTSTNKDKTNLNDHHLHQQLSAIRSNLQKLKAEANVLSQGIHAKVGQNDAVDHMIESLTQAEDSIRHLIENDMKVVSPIIGPQAQRHIIRDVVRTILQFIGLYGITITFGYLLYSFVGGILVSGGFLTASLAFFPTLFTSSLAFPPMFLIFEVLFGLSFVVGLFSWFGLTTAIESFGLLLLDPIALEQVGIFTLIMGLISSLFLSK